ncbi:MAG: glycosyltransferase [Bacteroidetes bacterium]|nr:glycosyltransferase [Bacteroidota bacterium]
MIKDRDIIVYGLQPFDLGIASTCKYTALEMSKNNRVLYVNSPLQRKFAMFHKDLPEVQKRLKILKGEAPDLEQINDKMWTLYPRTMSESINWIKSVSIFNFFNKINDKRFARKIKETADKLGFKNYLLFNDNSMITGFYLKELLKPDVFIYLLRDAVILVPYHAYHGSRLQPQIIAKADITVTNSDYFAEYARQTNPNSYMIGQGCDLSRYNDDDGKLEIPGDLKGIKKPIIGYVGFLTEIRLDIEVLVHIAEQRTDWNLVLVGPEDEAFKKSKLHQLSNVIFLGRKDPSELAAYIKGFDVALNPQIVNPITDINYPLKIDEYLAMGKPTVATKTTFMAYFKDITYLPSTKEEYIIEIDKALKEDSPELAKKRIAVASSHSWGNFVDQIYNHINDLYKKRKQ